MVCFSSCQGTAKAGEAVLEEAGRLAFAFCFALVVRHRSVEVQAIRPRAATAGKEAAERLLLLELHLDLKF